MCRARRVLVVDNSAVLRTLLELVLTDAGYAVHSAVHGGHARVLLGHARPCVILLDLDMPVMDGAAFARAYRQRDDADAHIVAMTAGARNTDVASLAPAHILPKPFDLEALLAVLAHWVDAHVPMAR